MQMIQILVLAFLSMAINPEPSWPSKLETKVYKTVKETFQVDNVEITPITLDASVPTPAPIQDRLFRVIDQNSLGYIYVAQAPSMKDVFDYIVVFNNKLEIVNSKVLIYREQHGRQIGTRRWLKQFTGLRYNDEAAVGQNIDGISGATISVTSMTNAVDAVLKSVRVLKEKGILDA